MAIAPAQLPVSEPTTPMKPSERVRFNMKFIGQCFGESFEYDENDRIVRACVWGTYDFDPVAWLEAFRDIPGAFFEDASCPVSGCDGGRFGANVQDKMIHLNDDHRWTRGAIADWLEGLGL